MQKAKGDAHPASRQCQAKNVVGAVEKWKTARLRETPPAPGTKAPVRTVLAGGDPGTAATTLAASPPQQIENVDQHRGSPAEK